MQKTTRSAFASAGHLRFPVNVALEAPVDIALGALTAIEIQGYAVVTPMALVIWERLMQAGFDVVITAGTDAVLGSAQSDHLRRSIEISAHDVRHHGGIHNA